MSTDIPVKLLPYKRAAWKPIVEDGDGWSLASKFSGVPYLKAGEEHPRCKNCRESLQLFVQLNLDELPEPARSEFGDGLLQMFYCTSEEPLCEDECDAYFPFSESVLVRIVQPDAAQTASPGVAPTKEFFPPKLIVGWQESEDYPNPEEAESLGIELSEDEQEPLYEAFPQTGDKLAGYPAWVQGIEYPNCPTCDKQMRLVFQIDSEDNLPYMFGDVGCGHITQCETHKEQLAFGWACG